jgi:hypothetical protein
MTYERSSAMAVSAKMAVAAIGEARSSRPGMMDTKVQSQTERRGVDVYFEVWPKKPPSGRPRALGLVGEWRGKGGSYRDHG